MPSFATSRGTSALCAVLAGVLLLTLLGPATARSAAGSGERCVKAGGRAIGLPGGGSVKVPRSSVSKPKRARICVGTSRRRVSGSNLRTTTGKRSRALRVKGGRLTGPVTLRLPFRRAGLKTQGLPAQDVVSIAFYDTKRKSWQTVPTTVDV